jgi:two-component system sensor histidine kinase AlgZ
MASEQENDVREFFVPDLCATKPVLILFILAELLVLVFVLSDSALPEVAWGALGMASLFVQWIVLLSAGLLCSCRGVLARLSISLGVFLCFLIILLVTLASGLVARELFANSVYGSMDNWWLVRNQLVAAVIGGIALRYFYMQQQLRLREQAELNARLESLRARIRPHFLFNTLNSIASLIGSRPGDAEQVVEDLSELFRASLAEERRQTTVADELHLCRIYLRIEQLRLGDRLQVDWQVDQSLSACAMPMLLLQPLVENAVYHGVARLPAGGTICIVVSADGDNVRIRVTNPVGQDFPLAPGGHQMALDNIQQRLTALYGDDAGFVIIPGQDEHCVELSFPAEKVK